MINKNTFVETLALLRDQRIKFENLRVAAEALSPGEYVNFMPEFVYETAILDLLTQDLIPTEAPHNTELINDEVFYSDVIYYFVIDLEFGATYKPGVFVDAATQEPIDISTAEKLYDYIIATYHHNTPTTAAEELKGVIKLK